METGLPCYQVAILQARARHCSCIQHVLPGLLQLSVRTDVCSATSPARIPDYAQAMPSDLGPVCLPTGGAVELSSLAAVGTWGMQACLLQLPHLEPAGSPEDLGAEVIPRSVLMASFEGLPYLLCGLGKCEGRTMLSAVAHTGAGPDRVFKM